MPLFDNPFFVMLLQQAWGFAVKYLPWLEGWPNRLIPWMKLAIAILCKVVAPQEAHAGFFTNLGHSLGWFLPVVQTVITRQIYETFIKPTLEHFGITGSETPPVGRSDAAMRRNPS